MALQQAYEDTSTGVSCPDGYYRVDAVCVRTKPADAQVLVGVYKDAQARQDGKTPVAVREYIASGDAYSTHFALAVLDGANPVKQAYGYLKTLPAFAGALDV